MNFGFIRVASVVPQVNVADCNYNVEKIINSSIQASEQGAKIILFPELSITSYSCGDLFKQSLLLDSAESGLLKIKESTSELDSVIIVGAPLRKGTKVYNCAVVICKGYFLGVVPKTYLSCDKDCMENRWFASSVAENDVFIRIGDEEVSFGTDMLFVKDEMKFAIEMGGDLWASIPPSSYAALNGANVILNMSASSEIVGKRQSVLDLIKTHSARCKVAYVYASAGYGESTTDVVYAGDAIIAENGCILSASERYSHKGAMAICDIDIERLNNERRASVNFRDCADVNRVHYLEVPINCIKESDNMCAKLKRDVSKYPFIPNDEYLLNERCKEIVDIQVEGLVKRLSFTGIKNVVIGVSGGLDSTLALLVCHKAFVRLGYDLNGIKGITMPGFGTTDRTYTNALSLMRELGVYQEEISIKDAVIQHFKDISHDIDVHDVTYENSQARERTQILMDFSNKCNGLVVGTGDLSELALGWATYNGDHMSMYGVNAGVPKTLVRHLVKWFAMNSDERKKQILLDIVDTPISPELVPADENGDIKQKTEDLVGPYELHDFFIYYFIRYGFSPRKIYFLAKSAFDGEYETDIILKWLKIFTKRFFQQQFKRSCLPDGPKVGSVGLSPRGDWQMPSDASVKLWLEECDKL